VFNRCHLIDIKSTTKYYRWVVKDYDSALLIYLLTYLLTYAVTYTHLIINPYCDTMASDFGYKFTIAFEIRLLFSFWGNISNRFRLVSAP